MTEIDTIALYGPGNLKPADLVAGFVARERTLAPTLVIDVHDEMTVMQEEIFGPILPVRTYRTIDEVVAYVNANPRPLALYLICSPKTGSPDVRVFR